MKSLTLATMLSFAATGALGAQPFEGQGRHRERPSAEGARAGAARDTRPEYERCRPSCPADTNPCHPQAYKDADGRCQGDS